MKEKKNYSVADLGKKKTFGQKVQEDMKETLREVRQQSGDFLQTRS